MIISPLKIIFFGTSAFAIPILTRLHTLGWSIIGVITKPDEPAGRGQGLTPPPIKVTAEALHLPLYQFPELTRAALDDHVGIADLAIVAAYGKIIPPDVLAFARLGAVNIHPSLLPRWRGPSPIQSAILHGDAESGVSIMVLDDQMDHGPLLAQQAVAFHERPTRYPTLHDVLAEVGATLLVRVLPLWLSGEIKPQPQKDSEATFCKLIKKDDGRIEWGKPADMIERITRAYDPWPGAWTLWPHGERIYRIRIDEADVTDEDPGTGVPGHAWQHTEGGLFVRTGSGSLIARRITIEGKKSLPADELVRGYPAIVGTTFV